MFERALARLLRRRAEQFSAVLVTGPRVTFFRERHGLEVDSSAEFGLSRCLVEVESAETVAFDAFASVDSVAALLAGVDAGTTERVLIYAGAERVRHQGVSGLPWSDVGGHAWPGLAPPAGTLTV